VRPNPDLQVHPQEAAAVMKVHRDAADSAEDSEVAWLPVVEEVVKSTSPTFVTSFLSFVNSC
jgi:hypothetical protein